MYEKYKEIKRRKQEEIKLFILRCLSLLIKVVEDFFFYFTFYHFMSNNESFPHNFTVYCCFFSDRIDGPRPPESLIPCTKVTDVMLLPSVS